MKKFRKTTLFILSILLSLCLALPAAAEEDVTTADTEPTQANASVIEIYDYEDLLEISEDPAGTYKLMADIDLKDVIWEPINFEGTLDGNGHAILNVTINQTGSRTAKVYDGNRKSYDASPAGFFGILEHAAVSNLRFLGVKISLNESSSCFAGGVAGVMEESRISDVEIEGEATLYTTGPCFGLGGIAGFGNGQIENCISDMTLVCVDEDVENKDEQFMGGAYAAGFIDLNRNDITIHGYDSDHGYVHNGGLVGMYILYPEDAGYQGYVTNNRVKGTISFFEDNEDRRAYCEPTIGEVMNWSVNLDGNEDDFNADEHFEYDVALLPHTCEAPSYQDFISPATHNEYGFTTRECTICGEYSYITDYTPLTHEVEEWTVTLEPTAEEKGIRQGSCVECGAVVFETVPKVASGTPETEEATEEAETKAPAKEGSAGKIILIIVIIVVVLIAAWLIYSRYRKAKQRKALAARRRAKERAARNASSQQRKQSPQQRPQSSKQRQQSSQQRPQSSKQRQQSLQQRQQSSKQRQPRR